MSVRQLKSGQYIIDYYEHGRRGKRVRFVCPPNITSESQAHALEKTLIAAKNKDIAIDTRATVAEAWGKYISHSQIYKAATTVRDLGYCWEGHLKKYWGTKKISEINLHNFAAYQQLLHGKTSNTNINKLCAYLCGFLRWAEEQGYCAPRQYRVRKIPVPRRIPQIMMPEEASAVIAAADPHYKPILIALYDYGLRMNELRNLLWENIDTKNQTMTVFGKGGKYRIIPISKEFIGMLPAQKAKSETVFTSRVTGGKIDDIRSAIKRACKQAGITRNITPHLFRHTFATDSLAAGTDIAVVQQALGHSDIKMTRYYTQVLTETMRTAGKAMKDYRKANKTKGKDAE